MDRPQPFAARRISLAMVAIPRRALRNVRPVVFVVLAGLTAAIAGAALAYLRRDAPPPRAGVRELVQYDLPPPDAAARHAAAERADCLRFLDGAFRTQRSVTVTRGASGCTGSWTRDTLTVGFDGATIWRGPDHPDRAIHVDAELMRTLRTAAALSCDTDMIPFGYGSSWVRAWPGTPDSLKVIRQAPIEDPPRTILPSPAHYQLDRFIDEAIAAYSARRVAAHADFHATVSLRAYEARVPLRRAFTVTVDGNGSVAIGYGRRRAREQLADPVDIAAVIDWVVLDGGIPLYMPDGLRSAVVAAADRAGWE
jgi:hypothetical protein